MIMRSFNFNCMAVLTYSCVGGRGRRRARGQRFEVQGRDTCERAPPWCSSFPSCPSYILSWDSERRLVGGGGQNDKWINRGGKRRKGKLGGREGRRARGRSLDEDEGAGEREEKHFRGIFSRSIQQHSHRHGKQLVLHSIRTFPQTANSLHGPCQRSTTLSVKGKREESWGKWGKKKKKEEEEKEGEGGSRCRGWK